MAGTGLKSFQTVAHRIKAGTLTPPESTAATTFPVAERIFLHKGDITKVATAAIVNAANSSLQGGGGVDGAIHRAAGRELLEECGRLVGCQTGDAKLTAGYRLPAKAVIHTVGPIYNANRHQECEMALTSCYRRSLELAIENKLDTVAFPSISTGVFGYPKEQAARTAVRAVGRFLTEADPEGEHIKGVVFVSFSDNDLKIYEAVLPEFIVMPAASSSD
ncbi:unnamed protein product [Tilletia controversa]|uniref:Macro domain-containing protein n=3 Tax=Tilletia TaxID=13289 RepID=A0A8X7MXM3_9BASI|nr:hypothetical protein CF336_g3492 [Tilletia laevis]KAE8202476.1 hypothetical protein CF328_g2195 [Tilletia controversa]KAE8264376.1 hypothetical protein A4X03_0g993 [Tilletia caries]KAE8206839.1 hypothetical protein CF335_g1579 [Tilletia laevis]KAE8252906.1 hypothetical protein A4X06_0g1847 [Tilletia controversa]